jgi:chaperonin GroES
MVQQTEKKLSLRPLGNRVVAKRLEQEETLKGGIILPDTAKKKHRDSHSRDRGSRNYQGGYQRR